jgi:hypothetical protein
MAISNELSSEIAVALIAAKAKEPDHLREIKDILIAVHSTLQQMTEQARHRRSLSFGVRENDRHNH